MKKIVIILFFIIINLNLLKSNDHCFCYVRHEKPFFISPKFNFNIGNNWSNGFEIAYLNLDNKITTYLNIHSTRLGSSLISDKINQDFFTLGITSSFLNIKTLDASIYGSLNIGYLNTENIKINNFVKSSLIISPELGVAYRRYFISFGYNVLNKQNINPNLTTFFVNFGFSMNLYYYCPDTDKYYWFEF